MKSDKKYAMKEEIEKSKAQKKKIISGNKIVKK